MEPIESDSFDFSVDCDINSSHISVVDRYFKRKYKMDVNGKPGEDQCVLLHSNKICIITLAPSHPILADGKTVSNVNFQIENGVNRLDNKVSGKGKRGAQALSRTSPLCHVTCSDGSMYTLCSCIKGNLIEANGNLVENPQLLTNKTETEGYVAIVLVHLNDYERETAAKLKTPEQYSEILKEREKDKTNNT